MGKRFCISKQMILIFTLRRVTEPDRARWQKFPATLMTFIGHLTAGASVSALMIVGDQTCFGKFPSMARIFILFFPAGTSAGLRAMGVGPSMRSEEHTTELQSPVH